MAKLLVLNGSPAGKKGNCAKWILKICKDHKQHQIKVLHLAEKSYSPKIKKQIDEAEILVFITGTYWDSWGSPLQQFLESATELEGTKAFLGKPAVALVLMHSVGGKGVLSRLQGVLNTLGCLLPPMSGMVYSLVSDLALMQKSSHSADFWAKEDVRGIIENAVNCLALNHKWQPWPVDRKNPSRVWLK